MLRVEPDIVQITFAISQTDLEPQIAFQKTHAIVAKINHYLGENKFKDVGASQITLSDASRYIKDEYKFLGYTAQVNYQVILNDLSRLEFFLEGIIQTGVNRIQQVSFQTTRLKPLRAQVRQLATAAAREKALIYCEAAGVTLGKVLHIEDVNPDELRAQESHSMRKETLMDDELMQAFNPSSISVRAAVMMSFAIEN